MPLFLIIFGYLFAAKVQYNKHINILSTTYLRNKYESILKPYFCFALLSLIYTLLNTQYTAKDIYFLVNYIFLILKNI